MVENDNYGSNPLANADPDTLNPMLVESSDSVDDGDTSSVCDSVSNSVFDVDTNSVLESDTTSPAVSETASNVGSVGSVADSVVGSVENEGVVDNEDVVDNDGVTDNEGVYESDNDSVDSTSGTIKKLPVMSIHNDLASMMQDNPPEHRSQTMHHMMRAREMDADERLANDSGGTHDCIMPLSGPPETRRLRYLSRNKAHVKTLHWYRISMAKQIVRGVVYMHSRGIVHGQLSCRNIFVDTEGNARIGNFAGCSIDGMSSHVIKHEDHHVLPRFPYVWAVTIEADIFALGSTLYELMATHPPYQGMSEMLIKNLFAHGYFPPLDAMPLLGRLIQRCWTGQYNAAEDVLKDLNYYTDAGNSGWY